MIQILLSLTIIEYHNILKKSFPSIIIIAQKKIAQADDDYEPSVQPAPAFDYRNFFDFGFFSNMAASVSGAPHPSQQSGNAIHVRRQKGPNTVSLEKIVIPDIQHPDASRRTDEFF